MNSKIGVLLLIMASLILANCTGAAQNAITPTNTIVLSPTSTRTWTPLPSVTSTDPPTPTPSQTATPAPPQEVSVLEIPLEGPITSPKSQISGMAWFGDTLIILPQYPDRNLSNSDIPALFALTRKDILDYLAGSLPGPLSPSKIQFNAFDIASQIPGFEGFEAIAFDGAKVYLTIEANDNGTMRGYMVNGNFLPESNLIQLDPSSLTTVPTPVQIFNSAYETLIVAGDQIVTLYEANGSELNPDPIAFATNGSFSSITTVDLSSIEYRLTDATAVDENGNFWVTNIFMPIEFWLYTISEPIFELYGKGKTHADNINVERMLKLHYDGESITLTDTEPIQLELIDQFNSRNWEALVALEEKGFLAMTDTYPETILAFIPLPDN